MSNEALAQIERDISVARKSVDLGDALERLRSNRDFKKIIQDGYFKDEAVRLVHLKAHPNMQTSASQAAIVLQMDAIGALNQYFNTVMHTAGVAAKTISHNEAEREYLLAEGVEA